MKLLFIENKQKTLFWERIAKRLLGFGHEIHWIVQNRLFTPNIGNTHIIPLPESRFLEYSNEFEDLEKKDRYCYIYKQCPLHYKYYYKSINKILKKVSPSFVFGESTLFHELITIKCCLEQNLKYLNPSTCRYPNSRFTFYMYDTQKPYLGSHETWSEKKIKKKIKEIKERKTPPDYMKNKVNSEQISFIFRRLKSLFESYISSEVIGEIYNTPKISMKCAIEMKRYNNYRIYRKVALDSFDAFKEKNTLVFPLQMQPESNIDVWGFPYNNQSATLETLVKNLGPNWNILIKPNPKSKYEISDHLLKVLSAHKNIYALKNKIKMDDLFHKFKYFFSTTGTINHEAILSGKTCYSCILPITKKFAPNLAKFPNKNLATQNDTSQVSAPYDLMKYLVWSSYPGQISDGVYSPEVFEERNLAAVFTAFLMVINAG